MDAVEINTWLTGAGSTKGVETEAAKLAREFAKAIDKPKFADVFVSRIESRFNELKNKTNIPKKYKDNRVYQHLMRCGTPSRVALLITAPLDRAVHSGTVANMAVIAHLPRTHSHLARF